MTSMPGRLRASVAVGLIVALLAPPAYAGGQLKQYTWAEAQSLQSGTEITLTLKDNPPAKVRVWYVDDTTLFTSPPTKPPKLPQRVKDMLPQMGANWAKVIKGEEFMDGSIRISRDGVFNGTKKLADLAQVVQIASRDQIDTIQAGEAPHSHKLRNTLIIVGAVFLTLLLLYGYGMSKA